MDSFFAIVLLVGAGWFWLVNMRAREIAEGIAVESCKQYQVQFLDATVSLKSMRPARNTSGHLKLRRCYRFEFSTQGNTRRSGEITLLGTELEIIKIGDERWIMNQ